MQNERPLTLLLNNAQKKPTKYKFQILCFLLIGILCLSLSIYCFVQISQVVCYRQEYYNPDDTLCKLNKPCNISIRLTSLLPAPIYLLYQLDGFYQNHRRYVSSRNPAQLLGEVISDGSLCTPYITNRDMNKSVSWGGTPLNPSDIASPCGAIAYSLFNDEFSLFTQDNVEVSINQTGITQDTGYQRAPNSAQTQWIDPQVEHFSVWMHTAGIPNPNKPWGRINTDLQPGNYTMSIINQYHLMSGAKYFTITNVGTLGGRNYILPVGYLLVTIATFTFLILHHINNNRKKY